MAFRKKAESILKLKPDILIVPECENPEKLKFDHSLPSPKDIFWYGKNPNKGLGVFSYSDYKFSLQENYKSDLNIILPLKVRGEIDFMLFAIWANNSDDPGYRYIGQVWKALHHYKNNLFDPCILAGDFNSNAIWDRPRRSYNHTAVVDFLEKKNIFSAYHIFSNQKHGNERRNTLYMYKKREKSYHIDYCFASASFIKCLTSVEIGTYKKWIKHSDHVPLITTFRL